MIQVVYLTYLFSDNISIKLFADDIKMYLEIEDNSQTTILQQYVDGVMNWAKTWGLRLSYNKCQHMCVTLRKSDIADRYSLSSAPLPCVLSCIDLGVCVDSSLSFSEHISNIVVRAKQRASLLLRCFLSKDTSVLTKAFTVYVGYVRCLNIVPLTGHLVLLVI